MPVTQPTPVTAGTPETDAVISIQGITKRFGSHTVLQDITFDVPRGKTSAVLGPSGTGKSVLLKTVIGLLKPEAGQVYIDGDPMVGVKEKEVLRIRRKIGVLFQDGALFGSMNLFDNIAFPLVEHTSKTDKEIREIVLAKSELVGLGSHLHKLPGEVSGGMRKRAGLARALVLRTEDPLLRRAGLGAGPRPCRVSRRPDQHRPRRDRVHLLHNQPQHRIGEEDGALPRAPVPYQARRFRSQRRDDRPRNVPVIQQFLAGRPEGPISMDEMADAKVDLD